MKIQPEYVRVRTAAAMLSMSVDTIHKRIAEGRLPRTHQLRGFTSPVMVCVADLHAMLRVSHDLDIVGRVLANKDCDDLRLRELHNRCLRLANILGSKKAIDAIIRDIGGAASCRLEDVDPDRYNKLRYALIRLANPLVDIGQGPDGKFFNRRTTPVESLAKPAGVVSRTTAWRRRKAAEAAAAESRAHLFES